MRCALLLVVLLAGCDHPALQNVPQPNIAAMAGLAAGAAAAATLADPNAAARHQEEHDKDVRREDRHKSKAVTQTVPADVFDRLDAEKAQPVAPVTP